MRPIQVTDRQLSLVADTDRIVGGSTLPAEPRDLIRRRRYSIRIAPADLGWAKPSIPFLGWHHPNAMGESESITFPNYRCVERNVSIWSQNQALDSLVFLDTQIRGIAHLELETIASAKHPERLPKVYDPAIRVQKGDLFEC